MRISGEWRSKKRKQEHTLQRKKKKLKKNLWNGLKAVILFISCKAMCAHVCVGSIFGVRYVTLCWSTICLLAELCAAQRKILFIDFIYMRSKGTHNYLSIQTHFCTHTPASIRSHSDIWRSVSTLIQSEISDNKDFRLTAFVSVFNLFASSLAIRDPFYSLGFFFLFFFFSVSLALSLNLFISFIWIRSMCFETLLTDWKTREQIRDEKRFQ